MPGKKFITRILLVHLAGYRDWGHILSMIIWMSLITVNLDLCESTKALGFGPVCYLQAIPNFAAGCCTMHESVSTETVQERALEAMH